MRAFYRVAFAVFCLCCLPPTAAAVEVNCSGKQIFTERSCSGDAVGADERALFDLVAAYRAQNRLPAAKLSVELSKVANRHLLDLDLNLKSLTHSWSNCPYDIRDQKSWTCVIDAPTRLGTGYHGEGYETIYRIASGTASPPLALEAWKKSTLHNSIILNLDMFKSIQWDEIGVAIVGQYAALWFGSPVVSGAGMAKPAQGLGVTYDQAVSGLTKLIAIDRSSSTDGGGKWQGTSADKKLKLEIFGAPNDIAEANMRISAKLESDGKLSSTSLTTISTLLKNLIPDWEERDAWLTKTLKTLGTDKDATRTQIIRKISVEMTNGVGNSIELSVRPYTKVVAKEIY